MIVFKTGIVAKVLYWLKLFVLTSAVVSLFFSLVIVAVLLFVMV